MKVIIRTTIQVRMCTVFKQEFINIYVNTNRLAFDREQ